MIVFDLRCAGEHVFEAWFASSEAFEDQRARGLVECPLCGDRAIDKAVMAPRIAAKGAGQALDTAGAKAALAALAKAQADMLGTSRWVGRTFASEARAMHEGTKPHASIHGQASPAEARALIADGVPVAPLPLPVVPPGECN